MNQPSMKLISKVKQSLLKADSLYLITFGSGPEIQQPGIPRENWRASNGYYHSTTTTPEVTHLPIYAYGRDVKISGSFIYIAKGFREQWSKYEFHLDEENLRHICNPEYGWMRYMTTTNQPFMIGNVVISIEKVDKKDILKSGWYGVTEEEEMKVRDENIKSQREKWAALQIQIRELHAKRELEQVEADKKASEDACATEASLTVEKICIAASCSLPVTDWNVSRDYCVLHALRFGNKVVEEQLNLGHIYDTKMKQTQAPWWKRVLWYIKHTNVRFPDPTKKY